MNRTDPPASSADYLDLLRDVGLPDEDIRSLHAKDGEEESEQPLVPFLEERLDSAVPTALARQLVDVLTQSRRGMNVTGSYWNYAPEVHLNEVFEPYGCSVTFRDATHGSGQSSFEVVLEDASGARHRTTFEYPETSLEDDNFPALLGAIERRLLSKTDLTFVLLRPIDRRWRVLMIEHSRLDRLRAEYGERIEFGGVPLLREDQIEAFESGKATAVKPHIGETAAGTGRNRSTVDRRRRPDATDELLARTAGSATKPADITSDPNAVFDGSPDELAGQATTDSRPTPTGDVEATDGELEQVFGDLSDVSLEPVDQGVDETTASEGAVELGEGADAETEASPDGIDELFEQIEREALTDEDAASPAGAGDGSTVVAAAGSGGSLLSVTSTRPSMDTGGAENGDEMSVEEVLDDAKTSPDESDDTASGEDEASSDAGGFNWISDDELAER